MRLLAGICIIGITQEFLKYAAVRYSVFRSAEFDERIDGIIYGAAAGLGYATFLNVEYVLANGGVDLAIGAVRIAVVALAQASFAGVTGYFLGRAKFENRGPFWLPVGLLLAAVLNGVVTTLLSEINRSGLRPTPLNGLILAALVAAATFIILFGVLRRGSRPVTVAEGANVMTAATMNMRRGRIRGEEPEWPVWLLVVVMLGHRVARQDGRAESHDNVHRGQCVGQVSSRVDGA